MCEVNAAYGQGGTASQTMTAPAMNALTSSPSMGLFNYTCRKCCRWRSSQSTVTRSTQQGVPADRQQSRPWTPGWLDSSSSSGKIFLSICSAVLHISHTLEGYRVSRAHERKKAKSRFCGHRCYYDRGIGLDLAA